MRKSESLIFNQPYMPIYVLYSQNKIISKQEEAKSNLAHLQSETRAWALHVFLSGRKPIYGPSKHASSSCSSSS